MDTIKKCGVLVVAKQGKFPVNAPRDKHAIHVMGVKIEKDIEQTSLWEEQSKQGNITLLKDGQNEPENILT